jgi:hypothetical protein
MVDQNTGRIEVGVHVTSGKSSRTDFIWALVERRDEGSAVMHVHNGSRAMHKCNRVLVELAYIYLT